MTCEIVMSSSWRVCGKRVSAAALGTHCSNPNLGGKGKHWWDAAMAARAGRGRVGWQGFGPDYMQLYTVLP